MGHHVKRFILGVMGLFLALACSVLGVTGNAWAWEPDGQGRLDVKEDPSTWCQWCDAKLGKIATEWSNVGLGLYGGGGYTIGQAGCMQFSMAYILRKSGVEGDSYNILDQYERGRKNPGSALVNSGGAGLPTNLSRFTGGKLSYNGVTVKSKSDMIAAFNNGDYLLVHVKTETSNGHWIAVDQVKDGDIKFFDSSRHEGDATDLNPSSGDKHSPLTGLDSYWTQGRIIEARVIVPSKGAIAANKAPTINDVGKGGPAPAANAAKPEDKGEKQPIEDLHLPTIKNLGAEGLQPVPIPERFQPTSVEHNYLKELQETREDEKATMGVSHYLNVGIGVIGILIATYAVFQVIFYMVDQTPLGVLGFYRLITFGSRRAKTAEDDMSIAGDQHPKPVGWGGMFLLAGVLFALGASLATGGLLEAFGGFWDWLVRTWNGIVG